MAITLRPVFVKQTLILSFLLLSLVSPLALAVEPSDELKVYLKGVVMPEQTVKLSFASSGIVRQLAKGGSTVNVGDILAKLDDKKARAELKQNAAKYRSAQSELASMQHDRDKAKRLVNDKILSDVALLEAEFKVTTAKEQVNVSHAQLFLAQVALTDCIINAPFTGAVIAKHLSNGEWTNAGDPVIEFVNLKNLTLSIDIPPDMSNGLYLGLATDVLQNKQILGKARVKTIYPVIDPASGLRRIVWQVIAVEGVLLTGRYVSLKQWPANTTKIRTSVIKGSE